MFVLFFKKKKPAIQVLNESLRWAVAGDSVSITLTGIDPIQLKYVCWLYVIHDFM